MDERAFTIRTKFDPRRGGAIILILSTGGGICRGACHMEQVEEFGWLVDDSAAMRQQIELRGAQVDKIYPVYEKQLVVSAGIAKERAAVAQAESAKH